MTTFFPPVASHKDVKGDSKFTVGKFERRNVTPNILWSHLKGSLVSSLPTRVDSLVKENPLANPFLSQIGPPSVKT